jgi:alpha-tubulin suppressor-like RCC1 family protein
VKCWGRNLYGQLGNRTTRDSSIPVEVVDLSLYSSDPTIRPRRVNAISAGTTHTCLVVDFSTELCWGGNMFGQLGDGTYTSSPVPVLGPGLGYPVGTISAGSDHTCAVSSGAVKCWGYNSAGQLGDGTTQWRLTPIEVPGLAFREWSAFEIATGRNITCAATPGGAVKCWGNNRSGQLGNISTTSFVNTTPVNVIGF